MCTIPRGCDKTPMALHVKVALLLIVLVGIVPRATSFSTYPPLSNVKHSSLRYPLELPSLSSSHRSCSVRTNRRASRRWSAASDTSTEEDEEQYGQSVASATFNLVKACVGTGVLTLPWGLAAMSDVKKAYV